MELEWQLSRNLCGCHAEELSFILGHFRAFQLPANSPLIATGCIQFTQALRGITDHAGHFFVTVTEWPSECSGKTVGVLRCCLGWVAEKRGCTLPQTLKDDALRQRRTKNPSPSHVHVYCPPVAEKGTEGWHPLKDNKEPLQKMYSVVLFSVILKMHTFASLCAFVVHYIYYYKSCSKLQNKLACTRFNHIVSSCIICFVLLML